MDRMERAPDSCEHCGLLPLAPTLKGVTQVVAHSHAMHAVLRRAARFAASAAPVAVLGETGTGKEVVARVLHANSPRAAGPFVAVNMAALPAELLESELFGHVRGAFTGADAARRGLFEAADGGTLFLDEIGEMPLPLQAKLLRALQDGELRRVGETRAFSVEVRIVCATHRDLGELVRAGRFREDLLYRLKVLTLQVPPLRERPEDVLPLATQLLAEAKPGARGFTPTASARLLAHGWPGNVRELQNVIQHAAALATGPAIAEEDLPDELVRPSTAPPSAVSRSAPTDLRSLAEVEREHILRVLDACQGSPTDAARVLGIARNTLWRKLRSYERVG